MVKRNRGWRNRFTVMYEIEPELLWALYWGEELSTIKIAELFGCHSSNIGLKMKEYGIPMRDMTSNHTKVKIDEDELYELYVVNGLTQDKIAKILGCNQNAVLRNLRKYGIKARPNTFPKGFTPWNKGTSKRPFNLSILRESQQYKDWRTSVFKRDRYNCQICHRKSSNLNAHHIKAFADFLEYRFDINNGITLCYDCHRYVHHIDILSQQ